MILLLQKCGEKTITQCIMVAHLSSPKPSQY